MSTADVKHDYHLVSPSPWPLVGSIAAFVMAVGGVIWMKGLFGMPKHTPWVFYAGLAGVLYTMAGWWMEVTKEANQGDHTPVVSIGLRYGMVLFIASEVMFFVAWFWIFFEMALFHHVRAASSLDDVRAAWATWPPKGVEVVSAFHLPLGQHPDVLLLSGTTVTWAHHALQSGDRRGAKIGLLLTVILGVLFTSIQAYEYHHILVGEAVLLHRSGQLWPVRLGLLHGRRRPRLPRDHRDHLPGDLPAAADERRLQRRPTISASRRPPGTGISSTWCGCSCSPSST